MAEPPSIPRHWCPLLWSTSSLFLIARIWCHCYSLFKCNQMPEHFAGSGSPDWPLPLAAACWDNREWDTQRLGTSNGAKVFLWPIFAKKMWNPHWASWKFQLKDCTAGHNRGIKPAWTRESFCLTVNREREKIVHGVIQSSGGPLNLFLKVHLRQQKIVTNMLIPPETSISTATGK